MTKRKVIALKNFPIRPPLLLTLTTWLSFDRIGISNFWWGVYLAIIGFLWFFYVFAKLFCENRVDIFEDELKPEKGK